MGADETALPQIEAELERSRATAGALLDNLARKLRIQRAARNARNGIGRAAHYVQVHSLKDWAAGIDRFVRRHPAPSLCIAVFAGFLVGRVVRSR